MSNGTCIHCGRLGSYTYTPNICNKCRDHRKSLQLHPETVIDNPMVAVTSSSAVNINHPPRTFEQAVKNPDTQTVMKMMVMDVHMLVDEYDMADTIFGVKLKELMQVYWDDHISTP